MSWDYKSAEQKSAMEEVFTEGNCGEKLRLMGDLSRLSHRDLAKILICRQSTISRLEGKQSLPTEAFIKRLQRLGRVGCDDFLKVSESEKDFTSETLGAVTSGTLGVNASVAAISTAGTVSGLSGAGITTGLAALGGTMLGGIAVVAAIPVVAALAGFGLVKGIKGIRAARNLNCKDLDPRYEKVIAITGEPSV
jgi:transcriptional regulator with XRE-family HTH domain